VQLTGGGRLPVVRDAVMEPGCAAAAWLLQLTRHSSAVQLQRRFRPTINDRRWQANY